MGLFSSIGGLVNDLTGGSSAANTSFKNQMALNSMSYEQQKEFAQNAHQWEVEDLKAAGLNPALSASGSSAGSIAGGGTTGGSAAGQMGNLAGLLGGISEAINQTKATSANVTATKAQAAKTLAEADVISKFGGKEAQARIGNLLSGSSLNTASAKKAGEETSRIKSGLSGQVFGTDPNWADIALNLVGAGVGGKMLKGAAKAKAAWNAGSLKRGFGSFLKGL